MKKQYAIYMFFCIICMFINLSSQYLMTLLLSGISFLNRKFLNLQYYFIIKLGVGSVLGFVTKFILDKFVIFKETHESIRHTARQAVIYTLTSITTTIIFWGTEITFKLIFKNDNIDLAGGLIGLAIGYNVKYMLDRNLVFIKKQQ